jgi:hypothetical protein
MAANGCIGVVSNLGPTKSLDLLGIAKGLSRQAGQ